METDNKCQWCCIKFRGEYVPRKKHEMEWGVIDEDFGHYVPINLIHYCPFCGRSLDGTD